MLVNDWPAGSNPIPVVGILDWIRDFVDVTFEIREWFCPSTTPKHPLWVPTSPAS